MPPGSTYFPLASMMCCAPISSKAPWLASATTFSSCMATSNGRTVYSFATRPFLTNKSYITECSPLGDGSERGLETLPAASGYTTSADLLPILTHLQSVSRIQERKIVASPREKRLPWRFSHPLSAVPISSVIRRDVRSLRGIERHRAKGEHLSASGNASPLEDRVGSQFLDRHTPCTILISRVPRGRRMVHDVVLQAEGSSLQGLDPGVHNPNSARWAGQHQAPRTHTYLPIAHRSPQ